MHSAAQIGRVTSMNFGSAQITGQLAYNTTVDSATNTPQTILLSQLEGPQDIGLIASIQSGFAGSKSTSREPSFICETGNCTWPLHSSLAICSSCHDVSEHVTSAYHRDLWFAGPSEDLLYYRLSTLELGNSDGDSGKVTSHRPLELLSLNATNLPSETLSFQDMETLIAAFSILKSNDTWLRFRWDIDPGNPGFANPPLWADSRPEALECALYFCVNEYKYLCDKWPHDRHYH
jgi:hypothetical protein